MGDSHWVQWHAAYEDPDSSHSHRLVVVKQHLALALDAAAPGPVHVVSMCAGEGRDVLDVVAAHRRRDDVSACLVELDPALCDRARHRADALGLVRIEVREADAASTSSYEGAVPAGIVLACGIFGNITSADIRATLGSLPMLMAPSGTVIWTRHTRPPDLTPSVRTWVREAGFDEVAFVTESGRSFAVGVARLVAAPRPLAVGVSMFSFVGDGSGAYF